MRKAVFLILISCLASFLAVAETKEQQWKTVLQEGYYALRKFMPEEALKNFNEAIILARVIDKPYYYAESYFGAGQAIWYDGRFDNAIDTVTIGLQYFREGQHAVGTASSLRILSNIYDDKGDYENAFKNVIQALDLYKTNRDQQNYVLSLIQLGSIYKGIGDYDAAAEYYKRAAAENPVVGEYPYRELNYRVGQLFALRGNIDSARLFYKKALNGNPNSKVVRQGLADILLYEKKYDAALQIYDSLSKETKSKADINIIITSSIGLGKVYLRLGKPDQALVHVTEALYWSVQRGARQTKRDAYYLLSAIYEAKGDATQALKYLKSYEAEKDSVVSDKLKGQLFSFKRKTEMAELKSLRDERMLAEQKISVGKTRQKILLFSIIGILLAAAAVVFLISLRHKNEKLRLQQRAADLEMQALRAQMNPHFIFNCLSAINHFILNKETEKASDYLTQFSRLLRTVLVNAGKPIVTLEEELSMLRLYLNMEQLRFKDAFEYYIYADADVQVSMVNVPSFLLQPFCENAIWHGLLHKDGKGKLDVYLRMDGDTLICTIKDNGIGRDKAAQLKTRSADKIGSFGHKLSAERLSLFNKEKPGASFTITDVKNDRGEVAGTIVTLRINSKQEYD